MRKLFNSIKSRINKETEMFLALGASRWVVVGLFVLLVHAAIRGSVFGIFANAGALIIWRALAYQSYRSKKLRERFDDELRERFKMLHEMLDAEIYKMRATEKWLAIGPDDRQKILKVRNMTESPFDGERQVAKTKLESLMRKHGITQKDLPNV